MGKATGFMEYGRRENPMREAAERLSDYRDLHRALPEKERR